MLYDLGNNLDKNKAFYKFNKLAEGCKLIELTEKRKKRTVSQNSYLHVVISIFSIEVGYSLYEAKTVLKRECSFMRYEKEDHVFLKRTRDLNTTELAEFLEFIIQFAAKMFITIPSSEEYISNQIDIDRHISHNKTYL